MKQLRFLLLLLAIIVAQGVRAQDSQSLTGSGTLTDPYKLGVGTWSVDLPASDEYNNLNDITIYQVFEFTPKVNGTLQIKPEFWRESNGWALHVRYALFEKVADDNYSIIGESAVTLNKAIRFGELIGGKTYYIGLAAIDYASKDGSLEVTYQCTNHNLTLMEGHPATCAENGTIDYLLCQDCGSLFTNDGNLYPLDEWDIYQNALGHDMKDGECTRCGFTFSTLKLDSNNSCQAALDNNYVYEYDNCTVYRVETPSDYLHGEIVVSGTYTSEWANIRLIDKYTFEGGSKKIEKAPRRSPENGEGEEVGEFYECGTIAFSPYIYVVLYHEGEGTANLTFEFISHDFAKLQDKLDPVGCEDGHHALYQCTHERCGGEWPSTYFTEEGIYSNFLNELDLVIPGEHNLNSEGVCTVCGQRIVLVNGANTVKFSQGSNVVTVFKYVATDDANLKVSVLTDAEILDAVIAPWDEWEEMNGNGGGTPQSAPRKVPSAASYTMSRDVSRGITYAIAFRTSSEMETTATVNLDYNITISNSTVDLATVLAEHPNVKEFTFGWETNRINVCTITRDITLDLSDIFNPTFVGQLKVANGANVVINGGGNLDFSGVSDDAFCFVVEDGQLTCSSFSNIYGGYHGVLVKKGSFTAQGTRIRANEAVVARKALGSTNDVAINIVEGSEVWGSKVAIYMDVNGHLTVDNPGTYQGIQGDTQSIVAKAGTIDLSNIERYGIRNNGPVGSGEDRPEPVMHGRIPYLYGVPAVALQVGTDEEGFTGTTTLRMKNVQFDCNAYEGEPDFQLVLLTGSAVHPTRYQMANVQGKGQIVVENADYVELVEPVVVHDGDNTNVNFVSGTAQETVLKYTATESKILEVTVATDATVENCTIIPWAEWDGEPDDDNNSDVQYARRKARRIAGEDNIIASKKVIAGNSYAIVFTTTTDVAASATVTLDYTDVVYPEVFFGENDIVIEGVEGDADGDYNHYNLYKFIAPASGQAHFYTQSDYMTIGKLFNSSMTSIQDSYNYDSNHYNYNLKIDYEVVEGETYYIGVRLTYGNETIECPLVVEIEGYTPPLKEGNNKLTFKEDASNFLYGEFYYSYVPQESGYVTISCDDAYYMRVKNNNSDIAGTEVGETTFSFIASANEDYIVYVAPNDGVKTAELTVVLEPINVVTTLSLGNNWINVDSNDCEDWTPESTDFYELFPFTPENDGILTVESSGDEYIILALFDEDGNFMKYASGCELSLSAVVDANKTYKVGIREDYGNPIALRLVNLSLENIPGFDGTLEFATVDGDDIVTENEFVETVMKYFPTENEFSMVFVANDGVIYKRATTNNKWGTVVLPYELESNDKVAYYELTAADIPTGKLEFTKVATVAPNTPTVYRIISGDQYDASVDGPVTVELPEDLGDFDLYVETKVDGWFMDGWYYGDVIDTQADDGYCQKWDAGIMYISGDKFWHAEGSVKVKPYRAIFDMPASVWNSAPLSAMSISFVDDDNITTTINSIIEENGEFTDVEAIYDLNGQRKNSIQRGVNIIRTADGKTRKFIKK